MRKKIFGAITFIAAIGGVIYMKNNPKYKEIVRLIMRVLEMSERKFTHV